MPQSISQENLKILIHLQKLCRRFGQINCCQKLWKVAQSPINRPIWTHCLQRHRQRLLELIYKPEKKRVPFWCRVFLPSLCWKCILWRRLSCLRKKYCSHSLLWLKLSRRLCQNKFYALFRILLSRFLSLVLFTF